MNLYINWEDFFGGILVKYAAFDTVEYYFTSFRHSNEKLDQGEQSELKSITYHILIALKYISFIGFVLQGNISALFHLLHAK